MADTQVVVLMGGLGTRLGLKDCPKALADINGVPFFDYQLQLLQRWRFHKFLFLVGYQANSIEEYYGNGADRRIDIQYSYDGISQLGTGGALWNAKDKLEDDFLLIYGDSFMDIDYQETVYRYQIAKKAEKKGLMVILKNEDSYDKSNVIYKDGNLILYNKANRSKDMKYIDYGVSLLSKEVIVGDRLEEKFDLADVLKELSEKRQLGAQVVSRRFYEIGTQGAKQEFCAYAHERFEVEKKAVFLDRDGVINELVFNDSTEWLDSPFSEEEFIYKEGIIATLKEIQQQGYYIFIVTNQPAAAKGKIRLERLYDLNAWLTEDLRLKGIHIEFLSMCPHYPEGSAKTEYDFLRGNCLCRKPREGMIKDLLEVYRIDREHSYMVGDSYTDIEAGKRAGVKTVFLGQMKCDMCQRMKDFKADKMIYRIEELLGVLGG